MKLFDAMEVSREKLIKNILLNDNYIIKRIQKKKPDIGKYFHADEPRPIKVAQDGKVYPL